VRCTADQRPGVTRVTAKAHALVWFWSVLEPDMDSRFPMHLLVEEGKHALATDKNGDGVFTPGYDVNKRINDAWGTRDNMRTGLMATGAYESWMAKVRRPEHRIFPPLPPIARSAGWAHHQRRPNRCRLRPLPPDIAGDDQALRHLWRTVQPPRPSSEPERRGMGKSVEEGVLKSYRSRFGSKELGLVWVFPLLSSSTSRADDGRLPAAPLISGQRRRTLVDILVHRRRHAGSTPTSRSAGHLATADSLGTKAGGGIS
jgi:hypothetical protein